MSYWITILFFQKLGTALGDWTADTTGFGYTGAAIVIGACIEATNGQNRAPNYRFLLEEK